MTGVGIRLSALGPVVRSAIVAIAIAAVAISSSATARSGDFQIPGGWFFTQGAADTEIAGDGFAIVDDGQAAFWSAFQEHGGVQAVGYPVSGRFLWDGFTTQVMQKAVFQWRPETGTVAFLNVFDDLSRRGYDARLADLLVPEPERFDDEAGLGFDQIAAKRIALLEEEPLLLGAYQAVADPLRSNRVKSQIGSGGARGGLGR